MLNHVIAYLTTATTFFVIDYIWLSRLARQFYVDKLGDMLLERPNMAAAAGFYLLYIIGIVIFAVAPALKEGSPGHALLFGALFGFFAYATYDMTNYATLKNWPVSVTIIDICWGTLLTGISAYVGFLLTRSTMGILGNMN